MKKKIIFGCGALLLAIIIVLLIVLIPGEESYRNIKVFELEGTSEVIRNNKTLEVYEEMSLRNNDKVVINSNSNLILKLDSDKFIYLSSNTEIDLISSESNLGTVRPLESIFPCNHNWEISLVTLFRWIS